MSDLLPVLQTGEYRPILPWIFSWNLTRSGKEAIASQEPDPAWVKATRQNYATSAIYRLRSNVLARICAFLDDDDDQQALRKSCYMWMRTITQQDRDQKIPCMHWKEILVRRFSGMPAMPFHFPKNKIKWPRDPRTFQLQPLTVRAITTTRTKKDNALPELPLWPCLGVFSPVYNTEAAHSPYQARDKHAFTLDLYCEPCRKLRQSPAFEQKLRRYVWCSGCQMNHPELLFTQSELARENAGMQRCIGLEGVLVVCDHIRLSRNDILFRGQQNAEQYGSSYVAEHKIPCSIVCTHQPQYSLTSDGKVDRIRYRYLFTLDPHIPITRQHLRDFVESNEELFDDILCRHMRADRFRLLLAFEPDRCACFPDPPFRKDLGKFHKHHAHNNTIVTDLCCRCRHIQRSLRKPIFPFFRFTHDTKPFVTRGAHTVDCNICHAVYSWEHHRMGVCIKTSFSGDATDPTSPQWLDQIDPTRWQDDGNHGFTWCETKTCMTNGCSLCRV